MGLISRVSSRTYRKLSELGEECLVYFRQSAKVQKAETSSKSPTSQLSSSYSFRLISETTPTKDLKNHSSLNCSKVLRTYISDCKKTKKSSTKMSAAKVRHHTTSTSSIDAVIEPLQKLERIQIDPSKLQITCQETFLEDVKILKPVVGITPPAAKDVLPFSPKQKIVVGVSGVSCGGKTTVASGLNNWLNKSEQNATLIMQDDFYKPASELPINSITNFPEFDEPESVRMDLIKEKILDWLDEPVELDQEDAQILIVEGTMIFTDP